MTRKAVLLAAAVLAWPWASARCAEATGRAVPGADGSRLLPRSFAGLDEARLLQPGRRAALWAVGESPEDFHPEREPLILVHGYRGHPSDLQAVADLFRDSRFQVYVLAYDGHRRLTSFSGDDFADELRLLRALALRRNSDLTIVAHSMGGLVARRALNRLASGASPSLSRFGRVRLVAVDTPWHGYPGPSDRGPERVLADIGRAFIAPALIDMRAGSSFFLGEEGAGGRGGVLDAPLPPSVDIIPVFARSSPEVFDYTEGPLAALPELLAAHHRTDARVAGGVQLENFWRALIWSTPFLDLHADLERLQLAGRLDRASALSALETRFPRYPGDHMTVLTLTGPGTLLEALPGLLRR